MDNSEMLHSGDYFTERINPPEGITTSPPIAEYLLASESDRTMLPAEIANSPERKRQAEIRRKLGEELNGIFQKVSNLEEDFDVAAKEGLVPLQDLTEIYKDLAILLHQDENNSRIILYLPFELLSSAKEDADPEFQVARESFISAYKSAWFSLLDHRDLRTNFVDGDVLEYDLRQQTPPLVVKAVHLLPELVSKQIISCNEIVDILQNSEDETLTESILETLPVLADQSLLDKESFKHLLNMGDRQIMLETLKSAHGFKREEIVGVEDGNKLLKNLDINKYAENNSRAMYQEMAEFLESALNLLNRHILDPEIEERLSNAVIAATRFWSMSSGIVESMLNATDPNIDNILNDEENYHELMNSEGVNYWVRLWSSKYLSEIGGSDQDASTEVLNTEQAWQRIHDAIARREKTIEDVNLQDLAEDAKKALREIDEYYQKLEQRPQRAITPLRIKWEHQVRREQKISEFAARLSPLIRSGQFNQHEILDMLAQGDEAALIAIEAVRDGVIDKARQDGVEDAKALAIEYKATFDSLKTTNQLKNELDKLFYYWHAAGVIDQERLQQQGLAEAKIGQPFSGDKPALAKEIKYVEEIVQIVEQDPLFKEALYPAMIIYGSRLKGYSRDNSDLDSAVFVRPNFPFERRQELLQKIDALFPEKDATEKVKEYWLEEENNGLRVRNISVAGNSVASEYWVHLLTQGAWVGNPATVENLIEGLLPHYLTGEAKSEEEFSRNREIWTEELERDVVQYKLMHSGYARFFPRRGGIDTAHSANLDSDSYFWDPGYRRLATQLYLSKVFLPDLRTEK